MRSRIPEQCADLTGRSRALCVIRLSQRSSPSSSSVSSISSEAGTGALTSEETLGQLLKMSIGEGTRIDVMRHLCGMVMGEFISTCAQGETNLRAFNRHLNLWFTDLGRALSDFMTDLNESGNDRSGDYFWNNDSGMFPWSGTGSAGTGSVKGWQWMNDTDSEPLLDDMMDEELLDGGMSSDTRSQRSAWDACEERQGPGKARCIRQYLEQQNTEAQENGEDL
jgi:hypothetical protein